MKKITVCVLFGGISTEHEISNISASSVLSNMDTDKYHVIPVGITKEGRWLRFDGPYEQIRDGSWEKQADLCTACILPDAGLSCLATFFPDGTVEKTPIDCVFPVLHGIGGEDGTVQGLCRLAGIPCVGSGVVSSALCMDKAFAKSVAAQAGLSQAKWLVLAPTDGRNLQERISAVEDRFDYPVFVKPANAGSSVGITKVHDRAELAEAIPAAMEVDEKIVVEEMISGQEVEVAVTGNNRPFASPVGEIAAEDGFYSYSGKYLDNTSGLFIPARLDEETAENVRAEAVRAYKALGCRGFARVDFFVTPENKVVFNEINTLPGFTPISMYPKLMKEYGMEYGELVDHLISLAVDEDAE